MTKGPFKSLKHTHEFFPTDTGTLMRDTLVWQSPFGILGVIINRLLLRDHLTRFLVLRNAHLKQAAESRSVSIE